MNALVGRAKVICSLCGKRYDGMDHNWKWEPSDPAEVESVLSGWRHYCPQKFYIVMEGNEKKAEKEEI